MTRKTIEKLTPINVNPTLNWEEFESGHGSEDLTTKIQHFQSCECANELNKQFVHMELDFHNGSVNETVLCIKVRILI